jgi:hypothetical protein
MSNFKLKQGRPACEEDEEEDEEEEKVKEERERVMPEVSSTYNT